MNNSANDEPEIVKKCKAYENRIVRFSVTP